MRYTWGYMVRRPVSEHMSCHQRWASNFGTVGAQSVMSISAWASLPKFLLQPMEFQTLHKRIYGVLFQVRTYLCLVSSTKCLRNLSDPIIRVTRSLSLYSLSISCLANSHVQERQALPAWRMDALFVWALLDLQVQSSVYGLRCVASRSANMEVIQ